MANDNDHAPTPIDGTWAVVSGATEAQPWRQVLFEYNRAHLAVVRDVNRRDRMHHFEADEARVVRVWEPWLRKGNLIMRGRMATPTEIELSPVAAPGERMILRRLAPPRKERRQMCDPSVQMRSDIDASLAAAADAVARLRADDGALRAIESAAARLVDAFRARRRVFSCGNGGSMCDAMHFAEELSGRFRDDRPPLAAVAISDPAHLTCTANDYGFDQVFARYVEAHGNAGDVLVALSTSGKSPNVLAAAARAKAQGLSVVALTGTAGSPLAAQADVEICTPVGRYSDRIQELHIKVLHILIELVERSLFPPTA